MRASLIVLLGVVSAACRGVDRSADGPVTEPDGSSQAGDGAVPGTPQDGAGSDTAGGGGSRHRIVFVGTSLTAGYGLEDPDLAYPALVGRRMTEVGYGYTVVNAGVSGDTSAGGRARMEWLLERPVDILVIELGANDGLRGQSPDALYENLTWIVEETRRRAPGASIVVAGMEAPPNLGPLYTEEFRAVFQRVARENDAVLIPFLLDGVAAVPELNQRDGIHPNPEGHEVVARTVWTALEPVLRQRCRADGVC